MHRFLATVLVLCLCAACATTPDTAPTLRTASSPAFAIDAPQKELIVSVSPARQTLQMAGTTGLLLGAGISAIANARHRGAIEEILNGYDPIALLHERLAQRLQEGVGPNLVEVDPLGSTTGYQDQREAERQRLQALRRRGHEMLLDLDIACGLYGFEGTLAAKVEGELRLLADQEVVWKDTLVVTSEEVLASDRLTDPTKRMGPNVRSPRLTVEEGAIEQWTSHGGAALKARMDQVIGGAASALLTALGVAEDAEGYYYLGRLAMNRKEHEQAHEYFQAALKVDPAQVSARNAMAINLAHNGQLEEAIRLMQALAQEQPEYGPAHYNLAWWFATELNQPEQARPHYERAVALGMPAEKKVEKALERS